MANPTQETQDKFTKAFTLLLTTNDPIGDVATEVGWSLQNLSTTIKNIIGLTPTEIRKKRNVKTISKATQKQLEKGVNFLLGTNDPITHDAAQQIGYSSQAAFSRAFKRVFGMTPQNFRKKHNIKTITKPTQERLATGIVLLLTTEDQIRHITKDLGYNSSDHFANELYRYTGLFPQKFRTKKNFYAEKRKLKDALAEHDMNVSIMKIAIKQSYIGRRILEHVFSEMSPRAKEIGLEAYREDLKIWRAQRYIRRAFQHAQNGEIKTKFTAEDEKKLAEHVGFSNVDAFNRFFSLQSDDLTPSAYWEKAQEKAAMQKSVIRLKR